MANTYKEDRFYREQVQFLSYQDWAGVAAADERRILVDSLNIIDSKSYVEGGINPNWKSDIRHHRNATTSLLGEKLSYRRGIGNYSIALYAGLGSKSDLATYESYGDMSYCNVPPIPTFSATAADNQARMRFYKRANDTFKSFDGLTFLGELREALSMLRNPAKGLRRGLDDYVKTVNKRSRRAKKSSLNRIVGETWLEKSFGWDPLINDVRNAGKAINDNLDRYSDEYIRITGTGTADQFYQNAEVSIQDTYVRRYFHTQTIERIFVKYYGQVLRKAAGRARPNLRLFGMSWRDLVPTAWELMPYSFLVDYFSNIGDVLGSYSVHTADIAWSAKTVRKSAKRRSAGLRDSKSYTAANYPYFDNYKYMVLRASPASCTRTSVNRSKSNVAHPSIRCELPGFGTKWINMTALANSRRKFRQGRF